MLNVACCVLKRNISRKRKTGIMCLLDKSINMVEVDCYDSTMDL